MTDVEPLFWHGPVLAQIGLSLLLCGWMIASQLHAIVKGKVMVSETRFRGALYPRFSQQAGDAFLSQFELPTLFYVLVFVSVIGDALSSTAIILSWIFVASRIAHSVIHLSYNNVLHRFSAWFVGFTVLLLLFAAIVLETWT